MRSPRNKPAPTRSTKGISPSGSARSSTIASPASRRGSTVTPEPGTTSSCRNDQETALVELVARIRERRRVYEDWGFADKVGAGARCAALFSGTARHRQDDGRRADRARRCGSSSIRSISARSSRSGSARPRRTSRALFDARRSRATRSCCSTRPTRCSASAPTSSRATIATPTRRSTTCCSGSRRSSGIAILTTNHESAIDEAFRRRLGVHVRFADARTRRARAAVAGDAPDARRRRWRPRLRRARRVLRDERRLHPQRGAARRVPRRRRTRARSTR